MDIFLGSGIHFSQIIVIENNENKIYMKILNSRSHTEGHVYKSLANFGLF